MADNDENVGYMVLPGVQGLEEEGRPLPVFGTDEPEGESLIVPDAKMTLGHFVVYPKGVVLKATAKQDEEYQNRRRLGDAAAVHANNQAVVVGRVTKNREPKAPIQYREGKFIVPSDVGDDCDVASGQAKFYVASAQVRDLFVQFSRDTMSVIDKELRKMATLVTIVDSAIHARPINAERGERFEERGFEVVAEFRQFVTLGMPQAEIREFKVYSEHGEYPVNVPRDVEMGMLIRMDGAVRFDPPDITRNMSRQERAARLLAKLKGV
jgi:hypothetical protein